MTTVDKVMTREVRTVNPDEVVGPLRDLMLDNGIHAVPVVAPDGALKGIVTSSDLVEEWQPMLGVVNVMSTDVATITPQTSLTEAARTMLDARIHHLVVEDGSGIVGIVSSFDLLRELAGEIEAVMAETARFGLHAEPGDVVVVRPLQHGQPERRGIVVSARGPDGTAPFVVNWTSDSHDRPKDVLFFPGNDAYVEPKQ